MGKKIDHRPYRTNSPGIFIIQDVELIETTGCDSDYVIRLKCGDDHYYRCSCAITFEKSGKFLTIK